MLIVVHFFSTVRSADSIISTSISICLSKSTRLKSSKQLTLPWSCRFSKMVINLFTDRPISKWCTCVTDISPLRPRTAWICMPTRIRLVSSLLISTSVYVPSLNVCEPCWWYRSSTSNHSQPKIKSIRRWLNSTSASFQCLINSSITSYSFAEIS